MRIGIDLGGTKIAGVALGDDGREVAQRRVATPATDYAAIVAAIAAMVRELESAAGSIATVGVGMPGTISPAIGLIKGANTQCLIGQRPWALWIFGAMLAIGIGLYVVAQFGQKLGALQTFRLHQIYEAAMGRTVEIH